MVLFTCSNLDKTFHEHALFKDVSFGMEYGERVGIIGRNGAGKTTLLRIIAGLEPPDTGHVAFNGAVSFEYLEQVPVFSFSQSALDAVMDGRRDIRALLDKHAELCVLVSKTHDAAVRHELDRVTELIEHAHGWSLETDAKIVLQTLGVADWSADVSRLSGGQRKRVALARALLRDPDLLILDEPTNHLDADSVQSLQDRLQQSSKALLLVTHDRYFLDAVVTRIVELEHTQLLNFPGDYEDYLERKEAMIIAREAEAERVRAKLRSELAWLQRGAPARRTKQKSRVDWIARMEATPKAVREKRIEIEVGDSYLGGKVIEAVNISKSIGGALLFKGFTHRSTPGERIGIIGPNGCGKSTLLNILAGEVEADSGSVKIGSSVNIGYFRQDQDDVDPSKSVIATLREEAEYIDTGIGRDRYLSASDMLNKFHFPHDRHNAPVSKLSGGERRRLALLMVLMRNPNVLFLDEPTNDFDIQTLSALEEYLGYFQGFLVVVSHDRMFLDRCVDFIYAFTSDGRIKQYPGNYSSYLTKKEDEQRRAAEQMKEAAESTSTSVKRTDNTRKSSTKPLTWKEERELEQLERDIEALEAERTSLNLRLSTGDEEYNVLAEIGHRLNDIDERISVMTERWLELEEKRG